MAIICHETVTQITCLKIDNFGHININITERGQSTILPKLDLAWEFLWLPSPNNFLQPCNNNINLTFLNALDLTELQFMCPV